LARLRLDHAPLGALVPTAAPISRVSGTLSGRLDLKGTRAKPWLVGELVPRGVGFTATAIAQPLSDIDGRVVFRPERISVERLTAHDSDGWVRIDGSARLDTKEKLVLALHAKAKEFPLRQEGRVAGEIDADADIDVAFGKQRTRVAVKLNDLSIWLEGGDLRQGIELRAHPDIVDPRAKAPDEPPERERKVPLLLSLDAHDSFWVRREDFAVKLTMKLAARIEKEGVSLKGPVVLQRGYLMLLGRLFDITDKSRLDFVGTHPPDPVLAIEATSENRRSNQVIDVRISGRTSAPELQFTVDGKDSSATDAARALLNDPNASGESATSQAGAFASGLTGGILGVSLRRELGGVMPVLVVEPATSTTSSRVRAGFELDSLVPDFLRGAIRGVYVEGMFSGGSEEQQQDAEGGVLIEIYLPADLVTSGQYGPGQTWSLDLGWEP
jgi:autotransporter translocation and assembly factor TamB